MGADMRVVLERGVVLLPSERHGGAWLWYATVNVERDYDLFSVLNGVRADDDGPLYEVKGFPPDAARASLEEMAGYDVGASWLTLDEARAVALELPANPDWSARVGYMAVLEAMHGSRFRVLFGCDQG